jgi:hypothetical protein
LGLLLLMLVRGFMGVTRTLLLEIDENLEVVGLPGPLRSRGGIIFGGFWETGGRPAETGLPLLPRVSKAALISAGIGT